VASIDDHTFTADSPVTARLALEVSARIEAELASG
jgi:hypothetical protein